MKKLNVMASWFLLMFCVMPLSVLGKGPTYKIVITGPAYAVEIRDAKALEDFRFGSGPGNFIGFGPNGTPNWKPKSWIVEDWKSPVPAPDPALPRLKASFHIQLSDETREYVIHYVYDSAARQGYVYLPGKGDASYAENIRLLHRGDDYDGHWFRATREWTAEVQAAVDGQSHHP